MFGPAIKHHCWGGCRKRPDKRALGPRSGMLVSSSELPRFFSVYAACLTHGPICPERRSVRPAAARSYRSTELRGGAPRSVSKVAVFCSWAGCVVVGRAYPFNIYLSFSLIWPFRDTHNIGRALDFPSWSASLGCARLVDNSTEPRASGVHLGARAALVDLRAPGRASGR